jgi:hypothetical protein
VKTGSPAADWLVRSIAVVFVLGVVGVIALGRTDASAQDAPALEPPRLAIQDSGSPNVPPPPPAMPEPDATGAPAAPSAPVDPPAPDNAPADLPQTGVDVQTRGPVHEAFAAPVVYDPKPGPIAPKAPPAPVEEQPPDQKPEGDDVQWIPGYWAWDAERNDFLWVSGLWRTPPPGRQWVPGYWRQAAAGWQWTPGAWSPVEERQLEYLPEPPSTLENGPNVPRPSGQMIWNPGCWVFRGARYIWRPGCWIGLQPNWVWVPPCYSWTPNGYLFVDGYWDYLLAARGVLFAPVCFAPAVLATPGFVFTPSFGIVTPSFAANLFVRPSWGCYYFGDYYASQYLGVGIFPWFQFHYSRFGFDPVSNFSLALNFGNPGYLGGIQNNYIFLRNNPSARPPRTLVAQRNITINRNVNITRINNTVIQNGRNNSAVIAQPITQLARSSTITRQTSLGAAPRFEKVSAQRRTAYLDHQKSLADLRRTRLERESDLAASRASMIESRADMVQARRGAAADRTEARGDMVKARQGSAAVRADARARIAEARQDTARDRIAADADTRSEARARLELPASPIASRATGPRNPLASERPRPSQNPTRLAAAAPHAMTPGRAPRTSSSRGPNQSPAPRSMPPTRPRQLSSPNSGTSPLGLSPSARAQAGTQAERLSGARLLQPAPRAPLLLPRSESPRRLSSRDGNRPSEERRKGVSDRKQPGARTPR